MDRVGLVVFWLGENGYKVSELPGPNGSVVLGVGGFEQECCPLPSYGFVFLRCDDVGWSYLDYHGCLPEEVVQRVYLPCMSDPGFFLALRDLLVRSKVAFSE